MFYIEAYLYILIFVTHISSFYLRRMRYEGEVYIFCAAFYYQNIQKIKNYLNQEKVYNVYQ